MLQLTTAADMLLTEWPLILSSTGGVTASLEL